MRAISASKTSSPRAESPRVALALQQISSRLIRSPHHSLGHGIEEALADFGETAGVDRVLVSSVEWNGFGATYRWDRGETALGPRAQETLKALLGQLALEETLVCGSPKELAVAALAGGTLPAHIGSGVFVPVRTERKIRIVLAAISRMPRSWPAELVQATVWLGDMVASALDRMATQSSVIKEQEKRFHAEAETRRLRDQLAHAGRVTMLGELAASMAHELNQPLTAIYTNAQAAQRFLDRRPPSVAESRAALHDLGQDCRRAGEVLGRLRQMFRRQETERVPLAVDALIEHVLKLLHEDAVARGVEVVLDIKHPLPPVRGDRVQLEQVVMNLLVNAFDAVTGIPGTREVTVRASGRNGAAELAVLDTGKGIARGEQERIFEPFFTRKPNGMGMGLAICRTIVEAHGGRISARSRAERGSVFEVTLPAAPPVEEIGGRKP